MDSHLTIVQHNVQSINNKKPLVKSFLEQHKVDILLLNETWQKDTSNPIKFSGYNFLGKNANNEHGGVGILIKNTFKYKLLPTTFYQDVQSIAISLETNIGSVSLLCVYCPPKNKNNNYCKINKLKNIIAGLPKPCIVSGDFNAHHIAFGCHCTNSRGKTLFDIFDEQDLCLLNTGVSTTVQRPNTNSSAIDVTGVSPILAPLCEWSVGDDPLGSYHYPTFTKLSLIPSKYSVNNTVEKFLFHKADWSNYYTVSEQYFKSITFNEKDPVQAYDHFCEVLKTLRKECIPYVKIEGPRLFKTPAPWWDENCERAVKNSRDALQIYKRDGLLENYIKYKQLDAHKKIIIKTAKKNSWHKLCSTFNRYTPITQVWNYMKIFKRMKTQSQYKNDVWIPDFISKFSQDNNSTRLNTSIFQLNNDSEMYFLFYFFLFSF